MNLNTKNHDKEDSSSAILPSDLTFPPNEMKEKKPFRWAELRSEGRLVMIHKFTDGTAGRRGKER